MLHAIVNITIMNIGIIHIICKIIISSSITTSTGGGDEFGRGQFREGNNSPPPRILKLAAISFWALMVPDISWWALDGLSKRHTHTHTHTHTQREREREREQWSVPID